MEFARRHKEIITKMYVQEEKSSYEIAEALNTYSTKILRALDFLQIPKRDYKEAQKKAMESGRSQHPTKGKKLDESHKLKIGRSRSKAYQDLSIEEKERISSISKENWDKLGKAKQQEIRELALEGVRYASRNGSKTERHIKNGLEAEGFKVDFHKTNLVPNSNLEVDLFLPECKTAIEIDGPGHFLPIWGEDKLKKQQSSDLEKQGILLSNGYVIIRVRQIDKSISITKMNDLLNVILEEVNRINDNFPDKKRLIEIEVKDGETSKL